MSTTSTDGVAVAGSSGSSSGAESSGMSAQEKRQERMRKLKDLHLKRNEARKLNHQEVVDEDKRNKLPENYERKRAQVEWEMEEEDKKKTCAAAGMDYNRVKMLDVGADEAARIERYKKKKNPDPGFSSYEEATFRQYERLTKQIKPDPETYFTQKGELGDDFYATSDSLIHGSHKPKKEAVDRLVEDVEKQIEKRAKYSRRRAHNEDNDVDYINERNAKFNKKLDRFYGKYTADIKQNLERGTAV